MVVSKITLELPHITIFSGYHFEQMPLKSEEEILRIQLMSLGRESDHNSPKQFWNMRFHLLSLGKYSAYNLPLREPVGVEAQAKLLRARN